MKELEDYDGWIKRMKKVTRKKYGKKQETSVGQMIAREKMRRFIMRTTDRSWPLRTVR